MWNDLEAATRHHGRNSGAIHISDSDGRNPNQRHDELPIRCQQHIGVGQPSDLCAEHQPPQGRDRVNKGRANRHP
jgi:hypothetical protein